METYCEKPQLKSSPMDKDNSGQIVYVGYDGWPVEAIKGRPILSWFRRIILTKKRMTYEKWLAENGCDIKFEEGK